jgi:hypothetical protein
VTETALTLKQALFADFSNVSNWMVTFSATTPGNVKGASSLIFQTNQIPFGGHCHVNKTTGFAVSTVFDVTCENWQDDGEIVRYELNGSF